MRLSALGTRISNLKVHFISYLQKKLRVIMTKHELYLLPIEVTSMKYEITEKKILAFLPAAQAERRNEKLKIQKNLRLQVRRVIVCTYEG